MSQPALHGNALVEAFSELAGGVLAACKVKEVIDLTAAGLERLGYLVGVVTVSGDGSYRLRYSTRPQLRELEELVARLPVGGFEASVSLRRAMESRTAVLTSRFDEVAPPEVLRGRVHALGAMRAALARLTVQGETWGVLSMLHEELREDDLPALTLFAQQVSASLEVAECLERLAGRDAELRLAHELAVAGPGADSRALLERALTAVAGTTQSEVAVLHRVEPGTGEMVLVGEPYNYRGATIEAYRRFVPRIPLDTPQLISAERLPPQAAAMLRAEGFTWLAVVPLNIRRERFGLLTLARKSAAPYSEAELRSAEFLGVQVASHLQRVRLADDAARLYADLKHSYDDLGRAQSELVRHERLAALGELAAVMAHEVRNPLGVIFNSLTTLRRLLTLEGDSEMLFNIVGEEAERLNRIVGDLLDFVRPYELEKKPTAIEPILASAASAATQALATPDVHVVTEVSDGLPLFPVDAHLLRQAILNLVVNAVQSMPKGGQVTVRARVDQRDQRDWLVVEVQDQGTGLSPRVAERIFQPFFTTKATGTGLGLAVVKRIVDAHAGEVSATTATAGGTLFVVRLPAGDGRSPAAA